MTTSPPVTLDFGALGHNEGIVAALRLYAREAHEAYTRDGRGLLYVFFEPSTADRLTTRSVYARRADTVGLPRPLCRLMRSYDPNRESLVAMVGPGCVVVYAVPLDGVRWPMKPVWRCEDSEDHAWH